MWVPCSTFSSHYTEIFSFHLFVSFWMVWHNNFQNHVTWQKWVMRATVLFVCSAEAALCTLPKTCHSSIRSPRYSQLFSESRCCTCTSCRQTDVPPTAAPRSPKACATKAHIKREYIAACYFPDSDLWLEMYRLISSTKLPGRAATHSANDPITSGVQSQ